MRGAARRRERDDGAFSSDDAEGALRSPRAASIAQPSSPALAAVVAAEAEVGPIPDVLNPEAVKVQTVQPVPAQPTSASTSVVPDPPRNFVPAGWVHLSVGGTSFVLTVATFTGGFDATSAAPFSSSCNAPLRDAVPSSQQKRNVDTGRAFCLVAAARTNFANFPRDPRTGAVFIDRDAGLFAHIANHLRGYPARATPLEAPLVAAEALSLGLDRFAIELGATGPLDPTFERAACGFIRRARRRLAALQRAAAWLGGSGQRRTPTAVGTTASPQTSIATPSGVPKAAVSLEEDRALELRVAQVQSLLRVSGDTLRHRSCCLGCPPQQPSEAAVTNPCALLHPPYAVHRLLRGVSALEPAPTTTTTTDKYISQRVHASHSAYRFQPGPGVSVDRRSMTAAMLCAPVGPRPLPRRGVHHITLRVDKCDWMCVGVASERALRDGGGGAGSWTDALSPLMDDSAAAKMRGHRTAAAAAAAATADDAAPAATRDGHRFVTPEGSVGFEAAARAREPTTAPHPSEGAAAGRAKPTDRAGDAEGDHGGVLFYEILPEEGKLVRLDPSFWSGPMELIARQNPNAAAPRPGDEPPQSLLPPRAKLNCFLGRLHSVAILHTGDVIASVDRGGEVNHETAVVLKEGEHIGITLAYEATEDEGGPIALAAEASGDAEAAPARYGGGDDVGDGSASSSTDDTDAATVDDEGADVAMTMETDVNHGPKATSGSLRPRPLGQRYSAPPAVVAFTPVAPAPTAFQGGDAAQHAYLRYMALSHIDSVFSEAIHQLDAGRAFIAELPLAVAARKTGCVVSPQLHRDKLRAQLARSVSASEAVVAACRDWRVAQSAVDRLCRHLDGTTPPMTYGELARFLPPDAFAPASTAALTDDMMTEFLSGDAAGAPFQDAVDDKIARDAAARMTMGNFLSCDGALARADAAARPAPTSTKGCSVARDVRLQTSNVLHIAAAIAGATASLPAGAAAPAPPPNMHHPHAFPHDAPGPRARTPLASVTDVRAALVTLTDILANHPNGSATEPAASGAPGATPARRTYAAGSSATNLAATRQAVMWATGAQAAPPLVARPDLLPPSDTVPRSSMAGRRGRARSASVSPAIDPTAAAAGHPIMPELFLPSFGHATFGARTSVPTEGAGRAATASRSPLQRAREVIAGLRGLSDAPRASAASAAETGATYSPPTPLADMIDNASALWRRVFAPPGAVDAGDTTTTDGVPDDDNGAGAGLLSRAGIIDFTLTDDSSAHTIMDAAAAAAPSLNASAVQQTARFGILGQIIGALLVQKLLAPLIFAHVQRLVDVAALSESADVGVEMAAAGIPIGGMSRRALFSRRHHTENGSTTATAAAALRERPAAITDTEEAAREAAASPRAVVDGVVVVPWVADAADAALTDIHRIALPVAAPPAMVQHIPAGAPRMRFVVAVAGGTNVHIVASSTTCEDYDW